MIAIDGTPNKGKLGANAILGLSLAVSKLGAMAEGIPYYQYLGNLGNKGESNLMPTPMMNVYLAKDHATDLAKVKKVAAVLPETLLGHLIKETQTNVSDLNIKLTLNKNLLKVYDLDHEQVLAAVKKKVKGIKAELDGTTLVFNLKKKTPTIKDLVLLKAKLMKKPQRYILKP